MIKALFGQRPTTKVDVIIASVAAVMAIFHAVDVSHQFKTEQEEQEIEK